MPSRAASSMQLIVCCDRLLALLRLSGDEVLVDRQHRQREAVLERRLFELVDVRRRLVGHLPVQDLDAVEPEPRGVLDHLLDRILCRAEVPVRVGRDGELDPRLRR